MSFCKLSGLAGVRDVLAPSVQRLQATAATVDEQGGGGTDMVLVNLLVVLRGGAEELAALEQSGASQQLEGALQVPSPSTSCS